MKRIDLKIGEVTAPYRPSMSPLQAGMMEQMDGNTRKLNEIVKWINEYERKTGYCIQRKE